MTVSLSTVMILLLVSKVMPLPLVAVATPFLLAPVAYPVTIVMLFTLFSQQVFTLLVTIATAFLPNTVSGVMVTMVMPLSLVSVLMPLPFLSLIQVVAIATPQPSTMVLLISVAILRGIPQQLFHLIG